MLSGRETTIIVRTGKPMVNVNLGMPYLRRPPRKDISLREMISESRAFRVQAELLDWRLAPKELSTFLAVG
jgi:hypothetical protein